MGSGVSGNYNGNEEKSQPYAPFYGVTKDLLEIDKKDSDIYSPKNGYFKNPTASDLSKSIIGGAVYINGRQAHGTMTYVMNEHGNVIFGVRFNPNNPAKRSPHPTLIGGKHPKVQIAGMITFSKGKIVSLDNRSGHYKPNIRSMEKIDAFMEELFKANPEVFSSKSKWRNN